MAEIRIVIHEHEKLAILEVIPKFKNETVAVSAIAKAAKMNQNRVRFIVDDLVKEGRLRKIPTKAFNPRYVRYRYEVV